MKGKIYAMDPVWREFITDSRYWLMTWMATSNLWNDAYATIVTPWYVLWSPMKSPINVPGNFFFHRQTVTRTMAWSFHYYHHALCIIWFIWLTKLSCHAFNIISPASTGLVISVGCIVDTLVSLWQIFSAQSLPHLLWVRLLPFAGSLHFRVWCDGIREYESTLLSRVSSRSWLHATSSVECCFAPRASLVYVTTSRFFDAHLRYMLTLSG